MVEPYSVEWTIGKAAAKAGLSFIASSVCFFFLFALLREKTIRKSSYNVYIIFLILPDAVVNLISHGLYQFFIAINGGQDWFPPGYYYVDVFSWFFYYFSNAFLNGIVAFEINRMLQRSHARKRTKPPSLSRVYKQVGVAYLLAALVALLNVVPVPFALFTITDSRRGRGYLGGEIIDGMTSIGITTMIMLVPMFYVILVRIRIWRKRLLPKSGRTRALSKFFMRIIIVFFVFYVPNMTLTAFLPDVPGGPKVQYWVSVVMGILTAAQALVNVYMIYFKDDIRQAVNEAWNLTFGRCCCNCKGEAEKREAVSSQASGSNVRVSGLELESLNDAPGKSSDQDDARPKKRTSDWDAPDIYSSEVEEAATMSVSQSMRSLFGKRQQSTKIQVEENPSSLQLKPPSEEFSCSSAVDVEAEEQTSSLGLRIDMTGKVTQGD